MGQKVPELSIVIPALNEEKFLPQALKGIQQGMARRGDSFPFEVIVCDNASEDQTAQVAREYGAHVIFEPKRQIARARNRGAAAAQGSWLLFLDADSLPTPPLFSELIRTIRDPMVLGGGAPLRLADAPWWAQIVAYTWNWISRCTRWAPGSFLFCRREAFQQLGGFDERLYISEEIDFSRRLKSLARKTGRRMVILREYLIVSGRKAYLYSVKDHLRFALRCFLFPHRVRTDPSECWIWYEGRR